MAHLYDPDLMLKFMIKAEPGNRILKRVICDRGRHWWKPNCVWSTRVCRGCGHVEARMYTKQDGYYWERLT